MSSGEVTIELAGEKVVLRPTFKCFRILLAQYGNLTTALQKTSIMDHVAYRDVIVAGSGKQLDDVDEMDEAIFEAGIGNLVHPLTMFLATLANGGKPLDADDEEDQTEKK